MSLPDWANALLFHGWTWNPRDGSIYRLTGVEFIEITEDGELSVTAYVSEDPFVIDCGTPKNALVVANAIASIRGGWA